MDDVCCLKADVTEFPAFQTNGMRGSVFENKRKTIFFFVFCSVFTTFAANLENREKNEEDLLFLRRCSDGADSVRG